MSTEVKDIVESFNIAKYIPQYANEARHPFFDAYREEIEEFSRVSVSFQCFRPALNTNGGGTESFEHCQQNIHTLFDHPWVARGLFLVET